MHFNHLPLVGCILSHKNPSTFYLIKVFTMHFIDEDAQPRYVDECVRRTHLELTYNITTMLQ